MSAFKAGMTALGTLLATMLASPAALASPLLACPVCAQRQEGPLGSVALGVFILMPWIIGITVALYIRRSSQRDSVPKVSSEE